MNIRAKDLFNYSTFTLMKQKEVREIRLMAKGIAIGIVAGIIIVAFIYYFVML